MPDAVPDRAAFSATPVPDSVRLQILATEHWSLLATRSMTWNEIFTRASMFLTTLSAAVVALALIAQATDFGESFRIFALVVLPAVLVLGFGTLIRLGDALTEDVWLVFGMNRLRHAYLEIAPDLEPFFITSHHDDVRGAMQTYGPDAGPRPSRILSATPTVVAVIDAMIVGVIVALLIGLATEHRVVYVAFGVASAVITIALLVGVLPYRQIARMRNEWTPAFPSDS